MLFFETQCRKKITQSLCFILIRRNSLFLIIFNYRKITSYLAVFGFTFYMLCLVSTVSLQYFR